MATGGALEVYRVGDFLLDVEARLLTRNGEIVPLPPKTFELFHELVRRAPGVVRRQELIDKVWPNELVNDEALTQRVMLLRRVLGDDPRRPVLIASAPRWGYRIVAPVTRLGPPLPATALQGPAAAAIGGGPPDRAIPGASTSGERLRVVLARTRVRLRVAAALAVALGAATVVAVWRLWPTAKPAIASVGVLPFVNVGGGEDADYLVNGIGESLAAGLGRLPALTVVAGARTSQWKTRPPEPVEAARRLRVEAVLAGRVLVRRERISVNAELVSRADGSVIWVGRFERPGDATLALEQELAREVASRLRPALARERRDALVRGGTELAGAYRAYLKGRFCWNRRTEEGFTKALAFFTEAAAADPTFAKAHAGAADCYALLGDAEYGAVPPHEAEAKARDAVLRALELDDSLAEAHATLGLISFSFAWDWPRGEAELRRAIALDPSYASARQWLAELLVARGRFSEAVEEIRRAQECDPVSPVIGAEAAQVAYYARDFRGAAAGFEQALQMQPAFSQALLGLALTRVQLAAARQAIATLEPIAAASGRAPPVVAALGFAYARGGQRQRAEALLWELESAAGRRHVESFYLAGIATALGKRGLALDWLERACGEGSTLLVNLNVEPAFDPLRGDPRFARVLDKVHLR